MADSFAHLHVHTEYSMLDGAARVKDLFAEAAQMGMPALAYRLYFRAHSLRSLKRNILGFVGIGPIRTTISRPRANCNRR